MSKKTSVNTDKAFKALSKYVETMESLSEENRAYSKARREKESHRDIILKDRKDAVDNRTLTEREASEKFSTVAVEKELETLKEEHGKRIKAINIGFENVYKCIPKGIHDSYKIAMIKGDINATGVFQSSKTEKTVVKQSLFDAIKDFLTSLGAQEGSDTQLKKYINKICLRVSGMKSAGIRKEFLTFRSEKEFNKVFISAIINDGIERNSFRVNGGMLERIEREHKIEMTEKQYSFLKELESKGITPEELLEALKRAEELESKGITPEELLPEKLKQEAEQKK